MDDGADIVTDSTPAPQVAPAVVAAAPTPAPAKVVTPVKQVAAPVAAPVAEVPLPVRETAQAENVEQKAAPVVVPSTVVLSAAEEALLKRAARFGIQPVPAVVAKVEATKKNVRAERFGLPVANANNNTKTPAQQNNNKGNNKNKNGSERNNGNNQAKNAQAVLADPEVAARLAKRAERFGIVSETLKAVQKVQEKVEEVSLVVYFTVSQLVYSFSCVLRTSLFGVLPVCQR